jgi:hypothetical protein
MIGRVAGISASPAVPEANPDHHQQEERQQVGARQLDRAAMNWLTLAIA